MRAKKSPYNSPLLQPTYESHFLVPDSIKSLMSETTVREYFSAPALLKCVPSENNEESEKNGISTPLINRLYHNVHAILVNFLIYMVCQQQKVIALGLPMRKQ